MEKKLKIGFIADDIKDFSSFDFSYNATFALMLAGQDLNSDVFLIESKNIKVKKNQVFANLEKVALSRDFTRYLTSVENHEFPLSDLDILFARKDPPINENFITYVQTLALLPEAKTFVINKPEGMLKANEKLYALNFPHIIPPTIVTYKKNEVLEFINEYNDIVIKPIFNKGGEGIFHLNKNTKDLNYVLDEASQNESKVILVQKYIPEVTGGDKRIVLLNGSPLGAIKRIPKAGEFRANVRRGALVKAYELTQRDFEICEALKPYLVKDGIYFSSIDVIGNYLIEVNVTCPASLQEVERCTGKKAAKEIVEWALSNRVIRNNRNLCL